MTGSEPVEIYGRLKEGVHFAGYSFERACTYLEWMLEEDRWRLGGQYDDVNQFLESIKLDQFRLVAEQRKRLARRIKELQPAASQRAIAKVVGVTNVTVHRDLNGRNGNADKFAVTNVTPPAADLSGAEAAQLIDGRLGREQRREEKKERRAELETAMARKQFALPDRRYGVILADPEWKFETWSEDGKQLSAENHYPCSDLDTIKARGVADIAADDCVLFLWATVPMLPHALEVMAAWGFAYRSHFAWVKDKAGTGYWNRNRHELLLVGVKGNLPAPAMGTQWSSVIEEPRGAHSAKPEASLQLIEAYFPSLPKIELNRRGPAREGWDAWGAEVSP